jgi:hypothetical protein
MLTVEFAKCSLEKATEKGRFIDDRAADDPTAMTEVAAEASPADAAPRITVRFSRQIPDSICTQLLPAATKHDTCEILILVTI